MNRKSTHVIVKSHHPKKKKIFAVLFIVAVVLAGWLLFEYGRSRAGFDGLRAARTESVLQSRIKALEEEKGDLSAQNAILTQASEIDRQAYSEVDRSLSELQSEILELKEEVAFYRGIVNSPEAGRGLHIQSFRLESSGDTQHFHYRLILTQYVKNNRLISGTVSMVVGGVQDGQQVELTHARIAGDGKHSMKFKFKYFQELEGDIELPAGFLPLRVNLKAGTDGRGKAAAERTFSWSDVAS
jgi:hypothetical protein